MPKRKAASGPIADLRRRVREAEKAQAPLGREYVPLDLDGYERLARLIERGDGTKQPLLRRALAIGLRVIENAGADAEAPPEEHEDELPEGEYTDVPRREDSVLARALGISPPTAIPPSEQRRLGEEDEPEDTE